MSAIRGRDTKPEMIVRRFLHGCGLRYRLHDRTLPGSPDIVLPKYEAVVQVHGCFWHQHPGCDYAYMPDSNREFWQEKLGGNRERDLRNDRKLHSMGWRVLTIWECEVEDPDVLESLVDEIAASEGTPQ